jgi:hypothetical protein
MCPVRHARVCDELALTVEALAPTAALPHGIGLLAALRCAVDGIDAGGGWRGRDAGSERFYEGLAHSGTLSR